MSESPSTFRGQLADKQQIRQVAQLMLDGVSSDPESMQDLAGSWWKRLFFRQMAAPRFLRHQMDTLVVERQAEVVGYMAVRYSGAGAGVFDWGVKGSLEGEGTDVFTALLDDALQMVADREVYDFFYIGLLADTPHVPDRLRGRGLELLDYQLVQMEADLPLRPKLEQKEQLVLTPKIAQRYRAQLLELLQVDYGSHQETARAASAVHGTLIGNSQLYEVSLNGDVVGVVQQSAYRGESRSLYALQPELWNSPAERQLVAALVGQLPGRAARVRVRTFSRDHLTASRPLLEEMGLTWQESVWHRWIQYLDR